MGILIALQALFLGTFVALSPTFQESADSQTIKKHDSIMIDSQISSTFAALDRTFYVANMQGN